MPARTPGSTFSTQNPRDSSIEKGTTKLTPAPVVDHGVQDVGEHVDVLRERRRAVGRGLPHLDSNPSLGARRHGRTIAIT